MSTGAEKLLILARGASRRHAEAIENLNIAEVDKRIAWENYDAYMRDRGKTFVSETEGQPK